MITFDEIFKKQREERLIDLFDDCFCGGDDFGVYRKDDLVYKVMSLEDEDEEAHPDGQILDDLKNIENFPKLIAAGTNVVIMSYEEGIPLDDYLEEEEIPMPQWIFDEVKKVVSDVIMKYEYDPYELEPRHVLVDAQNKKIKVIDVTGYQKLSPKMLAQEYKEELVEDYLSLFR